MKAILLARVSTEEQKDAGNSLPAQLKRMQDYCVRKGFSDVQEFSFDESAYKEKRDEFDRFLEEVNKQTEKVAVCFDKVDRLSRNVFDKRVGKLYEMAVADEIELHFVSDGQTINSKMSAVEKFQFGMSLGLAKYYSDAISDNTKRAFEQKRRSGEWTGSAPFGYIGVALNAKKRLRADIVPDIRNAELVQSIFARYASGSDSISSLAKYLNDKEVLTNRGKRFGTSTVHNILTNTFYYGKAYSRKYDEYYDHRYSPLIDKKLFDAVQVRLNQRNQNPVHSRGKKTYAFSGLIKCALCECSICREVKRGKPYYACTNAKKICKREYITEQKLLDEVQPLFESLVLSDEQIDSIVKFLRENHEYKAKYHKQQLDSLEADMERLEGQKSKLMDLLLDGKIKDTDYENKVTEITNKLEKLGTERSMHTYADHKYYITAKNILMLAKKAGEVFECSSDAEKNDLLKLVLSNASLEGKKLEFSIRKPFDTIVNVKGFPVLLRR